MRLSLAAVALAASVLVAAAIAAEPGTDELSDPAETVRWHGVLTAPVSPPTPQACADQCDEFRLEIALPTSTFEPRPGFVQVGIRWKDEAQDADLFVFDPSGKLAAKSDGFFASTAESVNLERPQNGTYRVVVVPRYTNGEEMPYEGIAQVERPAVRKPVRRLLPNLAAMHPRHPHFSIGAYLFDPEAPTNEASSCYPEEMTEQSAQRCLRFDQIIANRGEGPFELRYEMSGALSGENQLQQRIYRSDGGYRDRLADSYEFHPAHAHFHYKNFAQSRLWAASPQGEKRGSEPIRIGEKNGFCMIDVENIWFGRRGDAARAYHFPRCNAPTERGEDGNTYMVNGISAGWADVYNWYLADQFIEVSGIEDGCYVLESEADPNDTIVESDESDNTVFSLIQIEGDSARIVPQRKARSACG